MKLFVGLGNPGEKYRANRHNVGFMALDRIADRFGFGPWRKKFQGLISEGSIGDERVTLLKPETYMNESGRAVGEAMRFLKIPLADIYVFHDELDLAPGKVKVKAGGGNAGHNGLRSISAHIENDYKRVRLGIGHPGSKDAVVYYVLNDFAKSDREWLPPLLDAVADAAPYLAKGDDARFLSDIARVTLDEPETPPRKSGRSSGDQPKAPKASGPHPAGERASKRQSALAENLKKWLSSRKSGDDSA
ncbi:aminoacyl-tRNA hydrolase [Hyphomicrobium sp.]|jgi:PTH1 family peptidyl-tRNA hydrolase|uniref:aminoacyl-tRNA hydrolase n=1 Tax=Hyphomicrobium sp. TaxID=82 RepID=UPI000FC32FE7|nr:aminoacyl-tRNA hydrolase [Hyphomicrobium sp.]RUO99492.1 MAG: aminoacyl-tRNA hydrolase [Hyphomicrobium sp.]